MKVIASRRWPRDLALAAVAMAGCRGPVAAGRTPDPAVTAPVRADAADSPSAPPIDAPSPPSSAPPIAAGHDTDPPDAAALADAVGALSDEHPQGWRPAMSWLIAHPDAARPALVAIVERGGGPAELAVERAATVLGEIGDPADVPVLAGALARGGEVTAWGFAQALALHRAPEAQAALLAASHSSDRFIARAARAALKHRRP